MKTHTNSRDTNVPGLTILEMSIVIGVILSLVSVTFAGANAWKNGSNRAMCITNMRNVQVAVRSYQNVHSYDPGAEVNEFGGTTSIASHIHQLKYITDDTYDQIVGTRSCPGGGKYSTVSMKRFPPVGELFISCSLAAGQNHEPETGLDW